MTDNIQQMKCPSCGAPIALDAGIEVVVCEYCGTKVFVDDEIYKYQRILKAQSEAKKRDAEVQYELEKEREGYESRRKLVNVITQKPIECVAVFMCTIWLITGLIRGRFGLLHILIEVGVIIWAMGPENRPLIFTNMGIYFKKNKLQAFVFAFSVIILRGCFITDYGDSTVGLSLVALCALVWSIKSGDKSGMLLNVKKGARRVYVRKSASHYVGKQCTDVMDEMRACGFSDITTIKDKDLVKKNGKR